MTDPNQGGSRRDPIEDLQARIDAALDEARPKIRKAFEELETRIDASLMDIQPKIENARREVQPRLDQFIAAPGYAAAKSAGEAGVTPGRPGRPGDAPGGSNGPDERRG
jgi:hypothetical protein